MRNRPSIVATIAIILWGCSALHPLVKADDQPTTAAAPTGQTLNDDSLKTMLDGLGFEPKKLSQGYLVVYKDDAWTYNVQLVISKDQSRIGMNANLGAIEDADNIPASKWLTLLQANGDIDPSTLYVDKDKSKLYMHRTLDNRAITPAYVRQQLTSFCNNIKDTSDDWSFVK